MKKIYGRDNTRLHLTEKALNFYNGTDPMRIFEYEDDETGALTYTYTICGGPETKPMTEAELNADLESY